MSRTHMILLAADGRARQFVLSETGALLARAVSPDALQAVEPGERTVLVVPGANVLARWIDVPTGPAGQVLAAARFLMEEEIAVSKEAVHVALGALHGDGGRLACVVARDVLQAHLQRARDLGLEPDIVIPDYLLLPQAEGDKVIVAEYGSTLLVRGERLAFAAEPDLAELILRTHEDFVIEAVADPLRTFAAAALAPSLNLLQGEFSRKRKAVLGWRDFRRAAVLLAAVLLFPLLQWGAEIVRNEWAVRTLDAEARKAAIALVGAQGRGDPVLRVRGEVAALQSGAAFLDLADEFFAALSQVRGARIENLSYLREGAIRATLIHASAADLAALTVIAEQNGLLLQADGSQQRANAMTTNISLRPRS